MEKQQHNLAFDTEMSSLEPSKFTVVFNLNSCQYSVCNGNPVETLGEKELKRNATFSAGALSKYIPQGLAGHSIRDGSLISRSTAWQTGALVCIWENLPEYDGSWHPVYLYLIGKKWPLSVQSLAQAKVISQALRTTGSPYIGSPSSGVLIHTDAAYAAAHTCYRSANLLDQTVPWCSAAIPSRSLWSCCSFLSGNDQRIHPLWFREVPILRNHWILIKSS